MEQIKTTPAQEAREYAAEKGFVIATVGRRYKATHTETGTEFERGSYTALLNEMRAVHNCNTAAKKVHFDVVREDADRPILVDPNAPHGKTYGELIEITPEMCAGGTLVLPKIGEGTSILANHWPVKSFEEICADFREGMKAFSEMSVREILNRQHVEEQLLHEIRMLPYDGLMQLIKLATGATLDKIARAKGWALREWNVTGPYDQPAPSRWSDADYRVKLLNIAATFYCKPITHLDELSQVEFDDLCDDMKARIRQRAARPYRAWVRYAQPDRDGNDTYTESFATRPEALAWMRRHLSGKQGKHIIGQSINRVGA